MTEVINPLSAILVCDREQLFREALRNFLLAAGYSQVLVVATAREASAMLRREHYGGVMIGMGRPFSRARRLATLARRRQPEAKIFVLVRAEDQPFIKDHSFEYIIKEHVFASLLELLEERR